MLISLIQSLNGIQFLNTTSLSLLFWFFAGGGTGEIYIVSLTSIYVSL